MQRASVTSPDDGLVTLKELKWTHLLSHFSQVLSQEEKN